MTLDPTEPDPSRSPDRVPTEPVPAADRSGAASGWLSLLAVLAALTASGWALSYGIVVAVGFGAVVRKTLPAHPWHHGKASPLIFAVAVLWSILLCAILVIFDPLQVGVGMLVALLVGAALYLTVPRERRGTVVGVTEGVTAMYDRT